MTLRARVITSRMITGLAVLLGVLGAVNSQWSNQDCNGKGVGTTMGPEWGFILSPEYGDKPYSDNMNCIWTIEGYPEEMLELEVLYLDLEGGSTCNSECDHDSLEVWEYIQGGINPAERVAKLCGNTPGLRTYRTYSRSLRIKFTSDGNGVTGSGFALKYHIHIMNTTVEKFMFYNDNGTLLSPGYSNLSFPQGVEWYWYIVAPLEHRVQMVIEALNVSIPDPATGDCNDEFLRIRDGLETNPGIVRFCGYHDQPASLQSTGNKISVHFRIIKNFRGYFQLSWRFVKDEYVCGSNETGTLGVIQSPRGQVFPDTYPHYSKCSWNITVPAGKKVQLSSSEFYMEEAEDCKFDKLVVRDGIGEDAPEIGTYCGDRFQFARSSGTTMSVWFTSDSVINRGGFVIYWTAEDDLFSCTFESDDCGMIQPDSDHFDWSLNDGSQPDHEGPRAAEGAAGNHYYIQAPESKAAQNETAEIATNRLGMTGRICIEFIYHMFGKGVGELRVFTGQGVRVSDIWMASGNKGMEWLTASVSTTISSANSVVGWKATRSGGFRGDIAIDSIVIYKGECSSPSMV